MSDHLVIHAFSTAAAGIGAGLAPFPGPDTPILASLQTSMIMALAGERSVSMSRVAAAELLLTLGAVMVGRGASRALVRWIPGWNIAFCSITAAAVTEAIGWAAVRWFDSQASLDHVDHGAVMDDLHAG